MFILYRQNIQMINWWSLAIFSASSAHSGGPVICRTPHHSPMSKYLVASQVSTDSWLQRSWLSTGTNNTNRPIPNFKRSMEDYAISLPQMDPQITSSDYTVFHESTDRAVGAQMMDPNKKKRYFLDLL